MRVDRRENEDSSLGDGVKHHVEQQEDDEEDDGQDELQPFFGAQLKLVFAGPFVGIAGRQREFLLEQVARVRNEAAVVVRVQIDVDVTGERAVFIADHRRAARERDFRDLSEIGICAPEGVRNQDAP